VVVGVPVVDTIKKVVSSKQLVESSERRVEETLDRSLLWAAQTPQIFKKEIIVKAYSQKDQHKVTDDAMLVEKLGIPVKMVMGSYHNIKITSPADLMIAEAILKEGK
jgi:2-C-methyl-D-erythritol 4-phosphate cytidylyltransferase